MSGFFREYVAANGDKVEMTYVLLSPTKAVLRLDVNDVFKRRAHLTQPFEKSRELVADRWERDFPR